MTQGDGVPVPMLRRSCPVCERLDGTPPHRRRFVLLEDHPLTGGYDVAHCENCGAAYADAGARQTGHDKYFAEVSKRDDPASSTGSGESPLDRERLDRTADILTGYLPFQSRILDAGCAGGGLLAALQRRGYRKLAGVDPPPGDLRSVASRENRRGLAGLARKAPLRHRDFRLRGAVSCARTDP